MLRFYPPQTGRAHEAPHLQLLLSDEPDPRIAPRSPSVTDCSKIEVQAPRGVTHALGSASVTWPRGDTRNSFIERNRVTNRGEFGGRWNP